MQKLGQETDNFEQVNFGQNNSGLRPLGQTILHPFEGHIVNYVER